MWGPELFAVWNLLWNPQLAAMQKAHLAPYKRRHWILKTKQVIQNFVGGS